MIERREQSQTLPSMGTGGIVALGLAHAALFALAFPPFDLWPLVFLAPAPLAVAAVRAGSTRRLLVITYLTQLVMWLWLVRWITQVTMVGYPFLALYMAIWPTAFVWILRRVQRHPHAGKLPLTLLVPVIWTGVEYFRGDILFYGYPWYLLSHPLIAQPALVQSADLFGTYFIGFLAAAVSGFIAGFVIQAMRVASNPTHVPQSRRRFVMYGGLVLALWAANLVYGSWRLGQQNVLSAGPRVLAVQTNLPQDIKHGWTTEEQTRDLDDFIALTRCAVEQTSPPPSLIVWPETMVPGIGFERQTIDHVRMLHDDYSVNLMHVVRGPMAVQQYQREVGIPMLVGSEAWIGTDHVVEGKRIRLTSGHIYNSAYLLEAAGQFQRYDKSFLTPFGETMPYISSWPWLENLFLKIGVSADMAFDLESSPTIQLLQLRWRGDDGSPRGEASIATPICFEDTVARYCRRMAYNGGAKRVDVIVNISNDGWFGSSDADRRLHAMSARFRAIENRVPIVRSVNTGLSLWIDSAGRIQERLGDGPYGTARHAGWLVADVKLDSRATLYGKIGELWPLLCLAAVLAMLGWTWIARPAGLAVSGRV